MNPMATPPGPPFDILFFDCDSTLSAVERIDELARRAGVLGQIPPHTRAAMEGELTLEQIYRRRLEIILPNQEAITRLGAGYITRLVAGATETIDALHALDKQVHIVSGGIRQAVLTLAVHLDIPRERVHAVEIYFDAKGQYAGFDEASPTARSGGKAEICGRVIRSQHSLPRNTAAALVGDGVTDLEAAEADVFVIGFGGVVRREAVQKGAHAFVTGPSMLDVLDILLTPEERLRLADSR
jgi:phosphoserine phosphatase